MVLGTPFSERTLTIILFSIGTIAMMAAWQGQISHTAALTIIMVLMFIIRLGLLR
jgi:hypothetical protein